MLLIGNKRRCFPPIFLFPRFFFLARWRTSREEEENVSELKVDIFVFALYGRLKQSSSPGCRVGFSSALPRAVES